MSLHEGDAEAISAYLTLYLDPAPEPGSVVMGEDGHIRARTPAPVPPQSLVPLLHQIGYRSQAQQGYLLVTGRTEPVPGSGTGTPTPGTGGGNPGGTGPATRMYAGTPHGVWHQRARLRHLRELTEMDDVELLDDAYATDDAPVSRLRDRLRRRRHRDELVDHARQERQDRREEARERAGERSQERRHLRQQRRDQRRRARGQRRTERVVRRAQDRRQRSTAQHTEWEHSARVSGRQLLVRRQMARTPERKAELLARLQVGVLVVATLSIIGLGAASTASVHAFMLAHASASAAVAWGVEPAIILLVVGVTVARYVLSQTGGAFPASVTWCERLALVNSTVMAGIGGGMGAVVTPIGVVVVTVVAAKLLTAAAAADPGAAVQSVDASGIDQLMREVDEHLRREGTDPGTEGVTGVGTGSDQGEPGPVPGGTGSVPPGTGAAERRAAQARDKIAAAARELLGQGREVTPSGVRRVTGMKLPTVRKYWDTAQDVVRASSGGVQ